MRHPAKTHTPKTRTARRLLLRLVGLAGLVTTLACATTEADLKRLRTQVVDQRNTLRAAEAAADAAESQIATVGKRPTGKRLYIGRGAVVAAMEAQLPHRFEGSTLNKKRLKGKFRFQRTRDFEFLSGNRARWTWDFSASDVRVNLSGVPMAGKKDAQKARQALEGGGTVTMEASVWVDWKKKVLRINARCTGAKLRRHDSPTYQRYLCDGANSRLFRRQQAVKLPAIFHGKRVEATTTPNHLILSSK